MKSGEEERDLLFHEIPMAARLAIVHHLCQGKLRQEEFVRQAELAGSGEEFLGPYKACELFWFPANRDARLYLREAGLDRLVSETPEEAKAMVDEAAGETGEEN